MYRIFRIRKGAVIAGDVSFSIVLARDKTEARNMYDAAMGVADESLYTTVVEAVTEAQ